MTDTMTEPEHKPTFGSLKLHPRSLFLPAVIVVMLVLRLQLDMPWWGLVAFLMILPLYFLGVPLIVRTQKRALERDVLRLLQQNKRKELLGAYRSRWLLRLFCSSEDLQKQLGFIYSEIDDFGRAKACYERAAAKAKPGERLAVLLGLAKARYRSGDYEGAEVAYRELLRRGQNMPEVVGGLAHSLVLQSKELKDALKLAKKSVAAMPKGPSQAPYRLTLAEVLTARNKLGKAREQLDGVDLPQGNRWLKARHTWAEAQLLLAEDKPEALERITEVVDLDPKGGLGDLARKTLEDYE